MLNMPFPGLIVGLSLFIQIVANVAQSKEPEHVLLELLQPTALRGIAKNLSGLTWNHETGTLFAVTNDPECVYELSTGGEILRRIQLKGFEDTEGIAYVERSLFAIVEERNGVLSIVDIAAQATEIKPDSAARVKLGDPSSNNKGFESLDYDPWTKTVFTMRETEPFLCFSISLDELFRPGVVRKRPLPGMNIKDVASIELAPDGHLWVLSESSLRVVELAPNGEVLNTFNLNIDQEQFQPEGMAFGPDGTLYLVGEPNILAAYRTMEPVISGKNSLLILSE